MKFFILFLSLVSALSAEVQKIVVYRSQAEMEMEEYAYRHPEIYMYILGIMAGSAIGMIAYNFWKNRKTKNNFRNRY